MGNKKDDMILIASLCIFGYFGVNQFSSSKDGKITQCDNSIQTSEICSKEDCQQILFNEEKYKKMCDNVVKTYNIVNNNVNNDVNNDANNDVNTNMNNNINNDINNVNTDVNTDVNVRTEIEDNNNNRNKKN